MFGKIVFLEFLDSVRTFGRVVARFIASVTNNFGLVLFRFTVRVGIKIGLTVVIGPTVGLTSLGLFLFEPTWA